MWMLNSGPAADGSLRLSMAGRHYLLVFSLPSRCRYRALSAAGNAASVPPSICTGQKVTFIITHASQHLSANHRPTGALPYLLQVPASGNTDATSTGSTSGTPHLDIPMRPVSGSCSNSAHNAQVPGGCSIPFPSSLRACWQSVKIVA
jgi:hypothetical protein